MVESKVVPASIYGCEAAAVSTKAMAHLRRLRAFRRCAVMQPETFGTLCASMRMYCEQPDLQQNGPAGLLVHML
eukprot:4551760-Alexandrium_andersonii.AAC.1